MLKMSAQPHQPEENETNGFGQQEVVPSPATYLGPGQLLNEDVPVIDLTDDPGPAFKNALVSTLFLNDFKKLEQFKALGVDILPQRNAPQIVDTPVVGEVVAGSKAAVQKLLEMEPRPNKDTGIIVFHDIMTPNEEKTYDDPDNYIQEFVLGGGSFGTAVLIKDKGSSKNIVKKTVKLNVLNPQEILIPMDLSHICLNFIYGLIIRGEKIAEIYMEFGGHSFDKIVDIEGFRSLLTEGNVIDIAKQGFHCLHHLSQHRVMHLDIKPQNLCLEWMGRRFQLKFCDFGSCLPVNRELKSNGWTALYMSPEQSRYLLGSKCEKARHWTTDDEEITPKSDVYSFGCSLLFLCYWKHVLKEYMEGQTTKYPIIVHVAFEDGLMLRFVGKDWDPRLAKVLRGCFCSSPSRRISAEEALDILNGPLPETTPLSTMGGNSLGPGEQANLSSTQSELNTVDLTASSRVGYKRTMSDRKSLSQAAGGFRMYPSGPTATDSMETSSGCPMKKAPRNTETLMDDAEDEPPDEGNLPNLAFLMG